MSAETRLRVRRCADELDYVPNRAAQNLRAARSGTVGIYVPDDSLAIRYYMDIALGAVQAGDRANMLVTLLPGDLVVRSPLVEHLDGFIVIDPEDGDVAVERLLRSGKPVVSGEQAPIDLPLPAGVVHSDHDRGIRLLLNHLRERGSRHPLCILPGDTVAWGREMAAGAAAWALENGVQVGQLITSMHANTTRARHELLDVLALDPTIDAIISAPEGTAIMAIEVARHLGRTIGEDLLLASYVDSDPLAVVNPSITALDLNPRLFGESCMDLLAAAIENPTSELQAREVELLLVQRDSTRHQLRR